MIHCSHQKSQIALKRSGHALLAAAILLTTFGLVMVYAASAMKGLQQFGDAFLFIRKQTVIAVCGFCGIWIIGRLTDKQIRLVTMPLLLLSLGLLSLIFIPGFYKTGGGAARWISLFGLRFQPSEIAKLALVFFLAKNLSRPDFNIDSFKCGLLPNLVVFSVFALFMMKQPDFGSTVLMGVVLISMLFASGLNFKYILATGGVACSLVIAAIAIAPYRLARLTSFLDPWSEMQGGGFQIIQSYLAFQNGGFAGVGLGESRQKLYFLPEAHTDFILAVLGEEFGFLGVLLIVALFALFLISGLKITIAQNSHYRRNLALGLTALIGVQAAINMSVAMGLLPTKGIPLPFISSGASSLLISLTIPGFLWRLSKENVFESTDPRPS